MIGNILHGIFGKQASPSHAFATSSADQSPFYPLDTVRRGLARRARTYLETGQDAEVLADITAAASPNMPSQVERNLLKSLDSVPHGFGGHPERLTRFLKLRNSMNLRTSLPSSRRMEHRKKAPEDVQLMLSLFESRGTSKTESPTRFSDVVAAAVELGGGEVDIVTYLLPTAGYSRSLDLPNYREYMDGIEAETFIAALDRCDSKARTRALETLRARKTQMSPLFLQYLFQQFDESSSKLRDAARARLEDHEPQSVEDIALSRLSGGPVARRTALVQVLGSLGTPSALAALEAHRKVEKTQSVCSAIDVFLCMPVEDSRAQDGGYIDAHGAHIPLPEHAELVDDGRSPLDDAFLERMKTYEETAWAYDCERYAGARDRWIEKGRQGPAPKEPKRRDFAQNWFDALNAKFDPENRYLFWTPWQQSEAIHATVESVLDQLPLRRLIDLACSQRTALASVLSWPESPMAVHIQGALWSGDLHLRQVLDIAERMRTPVAYGSGSTEGAQPTYSARFMETILDQSTQYFGRKVPLYPGLWEVAVDHLSMIQDALPPRSMETRRNLAALELAACFPTLPAALLQPVLFAAIDERRRLQAPAQKLLMDVPGIDDLLIELVSDSRQAVRANAARFLAKRQAKQALPALVKRLKTEKSDLARADLISAVATLGGDTEPFIGKAALLAEAQTHVAKLPNGKIEWLALASAPPLVWADGTPADPVVLDGWLRLALKLKSPLGSPLFQLYFAQLTAESAAAVADWVLEAWIAYDTYAPATADVRAEAERMTKQAMASANNWMVHVGYTEEQILQQIMQSLTSGYANSAADSRGILALTHTAPPTKASPRIAAYLKQHGRRVSQAKSLVETLYGMGSKDAVQVLVATATRFKQRSVRELAETLVKDLAEARGWTEDALADRSVPTGGFEADGILLLPVGEDRKPYTARLGSDLSVKLFNPDGKEVKSIPAGKDDTTKEAKALLAAAKKTVKTVKAQQQARLYEAMLTPRVWDLQDWQDDLAPHPILQRLIERVIWRGLDAQGTVVATLRLTPEGEIIDALGDDVDMAEIAALDIAHTANLTEDDCKAWRQHLRDFEVTPLFEQVSRPVRALTEDQLQSTRLNDREGWLTTTYKLNTAAKKAGYDRGPVEDGGGYTVYRKEFRAAGIWADLRFTGSHMAAEDIDAAIEYMQFTQIDPSGHGRAMPLKKVPPLLVSEVWNDMHEIAKIGAFDADWKKKAAY